MAATKYLNQIVQNRSIYGECWSLPKSLFPLCETLIVSEQLSRIFRALQTSRVLHISMNARWQMNQL